MQKIQCPNCGREIDTVSPCPGCGHRVTGTVNPAEIPAEVATWDIERPSPDVLAWAGQTFNEGEYLAQVREIEQGGGHQFEDFIDEIERIAHGEQ